ncbi:hypothetical protein HDU96_000354 [Phlyctochytrium bullatum]|nr:hypothetical protein HDU96_000354 [Phlyctochytrium bullatum]
MAMSNLLATGLPEVYSSANLVITVISSVLAEISDLQFNADRERTYWFENVENNDEESMDRLRRAQLEQVDLISGQQLKLFVKEKLEGVQRLSGGAESFGQMLAQVVEKEILQDFFTSIT